MPGRHQLCDAPGDGAGLAGARTRQHAHRPTGRQHSLALLVVEVGRDQFARAGEGLDRHAVHHGSAGRQNPGAFTGMFAGSDTLDAL
jgi:hypothetical protein